MDNALSQPFADHLRELRSRLMWCILALLVGTAIGYSIYGKLLALLVRPLSSPLYFSSPAGGFEFVLQICLLFGFLVALPVVLYHTLRFIQPVLPEKSKGSIGRYLVFSLLLTTIGIGFAYVVSLPAALQFLGLFGVEEIQALITTDNYLSFATRYMFGFGILFQLPIVLLLVNIVSPLSVRKLFARQKWVILGSFTTAAILTPTFDIFNQLLFALPIIVLYQFSILLIWLNNREKSGLKRGVKRKGWTRG